MKDSEFIELVSAHLDGELDLKEREVLKQILRDDIGRHRQFEGMSRLHRASVIALGSRAQRVEKKPVVVAMPERGETVVTMERDEIENAADKWVIRVMTGLVAASIAITVAVIGMDLGDHVDTSNLSAGEVNQLSEMAQAQARESAREGAMRELGLTEDSTVEEIEAFLASMDATDLQAESFDRSVGTFSADPNLGIVDRFQLTGLNSDAGVSGANAIGPAGSVSADLLIVAP